MKVLDFGLAKALAPAATASVEVMNSPTLSARGTQVGVIIGTAAYMAPEQARGKAVDRRADIWAFGVVLYEMLSGQRAFTGEDISVTLASVIKEEVSWQALPADLPEPIRRLLRRCLEKDPRRRLRDIGEARLTLEDPASSELVTSGRTPVPGVPPAPTSLWRRALPIAATALIVGAAASTLTWNLRPPPPAHAAVVTRFPIVLPDDQAITWQNVATFAISPDGARIVYAANRQLYLRSVGDVEAKPIPGTNVDAGSPFFSPDGQWVGFFSRADSLLRKIGVGGGSPVTLCKVDTPWGATWDGEPAFFHAIALNQFVVVDIRAQQGLTWGTPVPLPIDDAIHPLAQRNYDVTPDGKQLLIVLPAQTAQTHTSRRTSAQINVVLTLVRGAEGARTGEIEAVGRTRELWTLPAGQRAVYSRNEV